MTGKDSAKKEIPITDPKSSLYVGQVFAEMLGMANKPEYYRYEDQEVWSLETPPPRGICPFLFLPLPSKIPEFTQI